MKLNECKCGMRVRDKLDGEEGVIVQVANGIVWVGQPLPDGTLGQCDFDPEDLERI